MDHDSHLCDVPRYFFEIAYDGTDFHGWQRQKNAITIQEEIETALLTLLRVETPIMGCGRTDAGVHAEQYFFHFDATQLELPHFIFKLNNMLSHSVGILTGMQVDDKAHTRFDAVSRSYRYDIHTHKDPFVHGRSNLVFQDMNLEIMNEAAQVLLKTKDFASFCKAGTDTKTTLCNVTEARWEQRGSHLSFHITANRFLRNMVRAIVGTIMDVGKGNTTLLEFQKIIEQKDRSCAGKSANACGLYLTRVEYPFL